MRLIISAFVLAGLLAGCGDIHWFPDNTTATPTTSLAITTTTLPTANLNGSFNQSLAVNGGTSPFTFSVVSGTLPTGLNLSPSGVISGTPTVAGTSNFTVKVTDAANNTATMAFSMQVT